MELNAKQSVTKEAEVKAARADLSRRLNVLKSQLSLLDLPDAEQKKLKRIREEDLFFRWQRARAELYQKCLAGHFVPATVSQNTLYKLGSPELVYYNFSGFKTNEPLAVVDKRKGAAKKETFSKWTVFFTPEALVPCLESSHLQAEVIASVALLPVQDDIIV